MSESGAALPYLAFDAERRSVRLDPHAPGFAQDPYPAYAFLHAHAPVFFWEDYGLWCLAGFDDVSRALRDRRLGRERPKDGDAEDRAHLADFDAVERWSLLELEPPLHTRLRALVNRAFVARQVERLRPEIERLAHRLVDGFEDRRTVDLLPAFATPIPVTVIARMLGVPVAAGPDLVRWSNAMVAMYMHGRTRGKEEAANAAARDFSRFLRGHVAERRGRRRDDLIGLLLAARGEADALSQDELVSSIILLLNASHEATVHQIGNAVRTILAESGDPRRFFRDPDRTAAAVEECLRFDPPLHMFTRHAREAVEIAPGLTLRPGEEVGLLLGAANSDPAAFANPRRFAPGRPDARTVSFGAGIHFCLGAPLARLEMQVALKVLFDRLPALRLEERPRYRDSYHFRGLERLRVAW